MSEKPTIFEALNGVMKDVRAVGKEGTNTFDGYNFRGIDGVLNHVGPALRDHGVFAVPRVEEAQFGTTTTGKGAVMSTTNVKMVVRWYGPAGDYIESVTWGSAFDRGDKSTAKAHSVAFRTALIQTLALPTQEPDPDEHSYDQGNQVSDGRSREQYVADFAGKLEQAEKLGDQAAVRELGRYVMEKGDGQLVQLAQGVLKRMTAVKGVTRPDGA